MFEKYLVLKKIIDMVFRLFIVFSLLGAFHAKAQFLQWEKAHQTGYQHEINQVFTTEDGEVLLLSKVQRSQSTIFHSEILRIGWDGALEWNESGLAERLLPAYPAQTGQVMGIGSTPSNCNWCAVGYSPSWSLEVIMPQSLQTNTFRSSEYMMDIDIPWSMTSQLPKGYFYASNGDYLAFGSDVYFRNAFNGNAQNYTLVIADTLEETLLYVGASEHSDKGFAVTATQAGFIDTVGVFSPQFDFGFTVDSVGALDSDTAILLYSSGKAYLISSSFAWMDSLDWQAHLDVCRSLTYRNGTFHALGEQNGQVWVKSFSNNAVLGSFAPDTQKVDFRFLAVSPQSDRWMLIGTETAVPNKHAVIQVYGIEDFGYVRSNHNLAVVELVEKPVEVISCLPSAPNPEYYNYHVYSVMVKVQNMGSESVSSFYLNGTWNEVTYYPTFICNLMNCRDSVLAVEFTNTPIAPGDFVWVEVSFREGLFPIEVQPVCVWVSTPNAKPDRVPEDDQLCKDIVLSTAEVEHNSTKFILQPNPSNGALQISHNLTAQPLTVAITDLQGRVLLRKAMSDNLQWIELPENMRSGMYLVSLYASEMHLETKRFVVLR